MKSILAATVLQSALNIAVNIVAGAILIAITVHEGNSMMYFDLAIIGFVLFVLVAALITSKFAANREVVSDIKHIREKVSRIPELKESERGTWLHDDLLHLEEKYGGGNG